MPDIDMKDVTGKPDSDADVQSALEYVTKQMIIDPLSMSKDGVPRLMQYTVIRRALQELLALRRLVKAAREHRAGATIDREAPTHPGKTDAIPPPPSRPECSECGGQGVHSPGCRRGF